MERRLEPPPLAIRLDVFLQQALRLSRRNVRRLLEAGAVRVNKRQPRKGQLLNREDEIFLLAEPAAVLAPQPAAKMEIAVLYEDDYLVAVNKPAGVPAHVLRPGEGGSVANFLLARFPDTGSVGGPIREAGLVHRLDTGTSGVLIAARSTHAYRKLRDAFSGGRVIKEYRAVVAGDVAAPGTVELPIAHTRRGSPRMTAVPASASARNPRPATTRYRPIERYGDCTLLAVEIRTGVRHQVRVHLASIGHPIAGDTLYGAPTASRMAERPLLHANRVRLDHPSGSGPLTVEAPLPRDLEDFLRRRA